MRLRSISAGPSLPRRSGVPFAVAVALCLAVAAGATARAAPAPTAFSDLAAVLARRYPAVRSVVVARGSCIAFEYYRKGVTARSRSPVYSIAKSALAILIGVAIDRGYLRLDETLGELLPEAADEGVDPQARNVAVRDLLTMTSGFDASVIAGDPAKRRPPTAEDWRRMLERPMRAPPGDRFAYDGESVDLLSVALARAIRGDALQFARRALFAPLGMEAPAWRTDADGRLFGETDLFLTARDMAKIGLLYLRGGRWGGARIVSEAFVADSTRRHNAGGPPLGAAYGYLWWIGKTKSGLDAFFAAGSGGQLVFVAPARGVVVAVAAQSGSDDNLALVDDVLLPAETEAPMSAPCVARLGPD